MLNPKIWVQIPLSPSTSISPPPPHVPPTLTPNFEYSTTTTPTNMNMDGSYQCPTCPKAFPTEKGLKAHKLSHFRLTKSEKIKYGHQCLICAKYFSTPNSLNVHSRVHSGIKLYKCEFCDKEFNFENSLVYHVRSAHEKYKPFQCEECPMAFPISGNLKNHVKNVHNGEGLYNCPYCTAAFKQAPRRNQHVSEFHASESSTVNSASKISAADEEGTQDEVSMPRLAPQITNTTPKRLTEELVSITVKKMKSLQEANLPIKKRTHRQTYPLSPPPKVQPPQQQQGKFIPVILEPKSKINPNAFTHVQITNNTLYTTDESSPSQAEEEPYEDLVMEMIEPEPKTASQYFKRRLFQPPLKKEERELSSEDKKRIFELTRRESTPMDKKVKEESDDDDGADSFIITGRKSHVQSRSNAYKLQVGDTIIECLDEQPIAESVLQELSLLKHEYSDEENKNEVEDPESSFDFDVVEIDSQGREVLRPYHEWSSSPWNYRNAVKSEKLDEVDGAEKVKNKRALGVPDRNQERSQSKWTKNKFSNMCDSLARVPRRNGNLTSKKQIRQPKSDIPRTEESFFEQALPTTEYDSTLANGNTNPDEIESLDDDSSCGIKILNTYSLASTSTSTSQSSVKEAQANDTTNITNGATESVRGSYASSKNIVQNGLYASNNIWW